MFGLFIFILLFVAFLVVGGKAGAGVIVGIISGFWVGSVLERFLIAIGCFMQILGLCLFDADKGFFLSFFIFLGGALLAYLTAENAYKDHEYRERNKPSQEELDEQEEQELLRELEEREKKE